jgi:hypothetical protein
VAARYGANEKIPVLQCITLTLARCHQRCKRHRTDTIGRNKPANREIGRTRLHDSWAQLFDPYRRGVGRGLGVEIGLGVGTGLGVAVGAGVGVGVAVGVGVDVGVGVGVPPPHSPDTVIV